MSAFEHTMNILYRIVS